MKDRLQVLLIFLVSIHSVKTVATKKLDVTIPKNVRNPYVDAKDPTKPYKPNKESPIIPIPKKPYTFQQ
jgi:hypothetical protein